MRLYLYIFLFTFTAFSYATDNALIFETNRFLIKTSPNCEEGNVACGDISYTGIRKSDGAKFNLNGKTLNRSCEKSTCDFYGNEFKNGKYVYTIYGRSPTLLTVTVHSDRGTQYCSDDYQSILTAYGLKCRMIRKGNCWDNAVAESFFIR